MSVAHFKANRMTPATQPYQISETVRFFDTAWTPLIIVIKPMWLW
jgi:hypothetical protein